VIGIIILLMVGWLFDRLNEAHERENKIYRDAARERWNSEKKESL